MKFTKLTSFIIASCIALGGSTYSTMEDTSNIVSISSTIANAPRMVPTTTTTTNTNTPNMTAGQPISIPTPNQGMPAGMIPGQNMQQPTTGQTGQTTQTNNSSYFEIDGYNDPGIYMQYALTETNAYLAWDLVDQKQTIAVAVIDTGVDYTHEDLKNRVSVQYGYDFVNNDNDPMDDNGHGTHVAGIIAAEGNNGVGIVGMVGDLDVTIVPIKALDADGVGDVSTVVEAIDYAITLGVDIINLSFGTESRSRELDAIVAKAIANDIFVVVAAGNSATLSDFSSPVSVDGVCAVGATNQMSMIAEFSNFGINIDVGAPGDEIVSTIPDNEYATQSGTSMASPIVAGAAAILLAQDPTLTVDELNSLLEDYTNDVVRDRLVEDFSFGIIDINASFNALN